MAASLTDQAKLPFGLTYDDVLLIPQYSNITSRKAVSTKTKVTRNISINIPIVASNMDTVCEDKMAVEMARHGALGILHRFCSVQEQAAMVRRVKRAQSYFIPNPLSIKLTATIEEAGNLMNWEGRQGGVPSLVVVDPQNDRKLVGIISVSDLAYAEPFQLVKDFMVPLHRLIVTRDEKISFTEAARIIRENRTNCLPVLNAEGEIKSLITQADVRKLQLHKEASLDKQGRLLCGAAIGVKEEDMNRARALVKEGVDLLVVDIAHGHSELCIRMVKRLKEDPLTKNVDILAGNIATPEGARDLIAAGADGLKIGVGPGSICITRMVAGSGVPQLSAVMACAKEARKLSGGTIPCMADGGIKTPGDISKAIAAGASCVMLGNMLAGTDEAPGRTFTKDGRKVKIIRGMAGLGANVSKAERERRNNEDVFSELVPEGVEGSIPVRGPVKPILYQLVGGLRSGMSYCGAKTIEEMHEKARFIRMSAAGARESASHDISKL